MSEEVLSQNEIDSLLSAISSGEMDANELKEDQQEQKKLKSMILNGLYGFLKIK